ncbi:protein Teyrha-meyrha-like isoform X2 [Sitodiplosis mosellana]|nr:protein Teyrha-meyrha-like isoform X2 [Sitodiplosis mosellana]
MAMEGSDYGSAHLPSPALVVFSQAANGLSEALRIQRPFHSQIQDAKDLHHLSLVGSYGAHLLHGFPPHFLHPTVTSASSASNPFSSSGGAFVKPFPSNLPLPSAFAPPTKCVGLGLEQGILFSGSESFRTDSSSPACTSLSPPVKEESLEAHTSEEGDRDRICSPERSPEAPGFRPPKTNGAEPINLHMDTSGHSLYRFPFYNSFKNFHQHQSAIKKVTTSIGTPPSNSCPVCGVHLLSNELETHFLAELDRLYKLSSGPERQRIRASFNMNSGMHMNNGLIQGPDSRWETFQRIRTNRQGRLRAKTRKRKGDSESEYPEHIRNSQCQSCPVCHGRLQRTPEEIAQHVEDCLRKSGQSRCEEEDETVDVESYGDETASSAMNLAASQNNNNITKMDTIRPTMRPMPFTSSSASMPTEDHLITSRNSIWQQHTKHAQHRLGSSPPSMSAPSLSLVNSMPAMGCGPPTMFPSSNESGATPTSSDQINEYDRSVESPNRLIVQERNRIVDLQKTNSRDLKNGAETTQHNNNNNCDNDNDEEVIVTHDEGECPTAKKMPSTKDLKRNDKNSAEEAVSSMEIDSSANDLTNHKALITSPDSYVSTTNEPTEPASRAQVLEELRARIRELEGSPLKLRGHDEESHYKCYI